MTSGADRPTLDELRLGDPPDRWRALGFAVAGDRTCDIGVVRLRLGVAGGGPGLLGWSLRGIGAGALDGVDTAASDAPDREPAPPHPNGAIAVDHVVMATPDVDRTFAALAARGLELRRERDVGSARQGFYVLGGALLEVVGPKTPDGDGPASLWGLTIVVEDLDALATRLGPLLGEPRDAVQPGRRIAPLRREAGRGTALAFMTPRTPGGG